MSSPSSLSATQNLSCSTAIHDYITKIISISGRKALILDEETVGIVSMVYSQSDILSKEVYLVEQLSQFTKSKQQSITAMHHLKAIIFCRPTHSTYLHLKALLLSKKYSEYYLFFSAIVDESYLRQIADIDSSHQIKLVQEYYADFYAITDCLMSCEMKYTRALFSPAIEYTENERNKFERQIHAIQSLLLSMKRRPDIRYTSSSELTKSIATELSRRMREEADLFNFPSQLDIPLLLILDRRDDPVTPLLSQWTYQAMVHELIGINNNRVSLQDARGVRADLKEVVLNPAQDQFFRQSMLLNFGDLGSTIKQLVTDYQRTANTTVKLDTIEDMQRFVDNYPEFKQMSGTVSKHVAIVGELSKIVNQRNLLDVSELEQELACSQDHSSAYEKIQRFIADPKIEFSDKLRLAMLYALRYENSKHFIPQIKQLLRNAAITREQTRSIQAIEQLLSYAGFKQRGGDLFGNKTLISAASNWVKSGLKGIENIYTQHKAALIEILQSLNQGKLKVNSFPYVEGSNSATRAANRYKLIYIYIVGGATYEESAAVELFNKENIGAVRVILGGSYIHNSKSFIEDIMHYAERSGALHDD